VVTEREPDDYLSASNSFGFQATPSPFRPCPDFSRVGVDHWMTPLVFISPSSVRNCLIAASEFQLDLSTAKTALP
jgi:hypothetical protein